MLREETNLWNSDESQKGGMRDLIDRARGGWQPPTVKIQAPFQELQEAAESPINLAVDPPTQPREQQPPVNPAADSTTQPGESPSAPATCAPKSTLQVQTSAASDSSPTARDLRARERQKRAREHDDHGESADEDDNGEPKRPKLNVGTAAAKLDCGCPPPPPPPITAIQAQATSSAAALTDKEDACCCFGYDDTCDDMFSDNGDHGTTGSAIEKLNGLADRVLPIAFKGTCTFVQAVNEDDMTGCSGIAESMLILKRTLMQTLGGGHKMGFYSDYLQSKGPVAGPTDHEIALLGMVRDGLELKTTSADPQMLMIVSSHIG